MELDDIKKNYPIEDVARSLGIRIERKGSSVFISCPDPNHTDENPSALINPKKNSYKCMACEAWGSNIDVVMNHKGMNFKEACDFLTNNEFSKSSKLSKTPYKPIVEASPIDTHQKAKGIEFSTIYTCLFEQLPDVIDEHNHLTKNRGVSINTLRKAGIKAIPDTFEFWNNMKSKFSEQQLKESGLMTSKNGFIFAYCDFLFSSWTDGKVSYLQGVPKDRNKYRNLGKVQKPFLFTPRTMSEYKPCDSIYVSEGVVDMLSFLELGYSSIAIMDASTTNIESKAKELDVLRPFHNVLVLDNDKAGLNLKIKLATYMNAKSFDVDVQSIEPFDKLFDTNDSNDMNEVLMKLKGAGDA